MANRVSLSWDWTPFDEPLANPPAEDEQETVNPTNVDPRPIHSEVADIDKTLLELEEQLAKLRLKRLQILADNALINRIPPEILSRIFELGNHESQHLLPIISVVCQHWRKTSLSTPVLWSYVRLDHDWNYGRAAEFLRKVKTHMERSQAAKILIDLDFRYSESLAEARAIMGALQPHLPRCYSFRVSVPDWDWMAVVKEHSSGMAPALEEIALRIDSGDSEDSAPVPVLAADAEYPRLMSITLEQTPLACVRAALPALRRFHLVRDARYHSNQRIRVALKELLAMLTVTDTLEDVRLQSALFFLDGSEAVFCGEPELTLVPHLTDLAISLVDATNVGLLLDSLCLPSLFRLAVQMDAGPEGENPGWLARLAHGIETRMPALRHLELRACNIDGAALAPFVRALHGMPQLTALGLAAPPAGAVGARFFDLLAAGPERTGRWILPNLQVLSLNGCRDVSGHELLRVVRARQGSVQRDVADIRMLRIVPCYSLDPEIVEALRQNVEVLSIVG